MGWTGLLRPQAQVPTHPHLIPQPGYNAGKGGGLVQRQRWGCPEGHLRCVPHRPSLPLPTCRRWPRRQRCAHCSGARGARWPRGSHLSRLWNGGRRRRLGAHSTLGRRKQPRLQVRATGFLSGFGNQQCHLPGTKKTGGNCSRIVFARVTRLDMGWEGGANPFLDVREGKKR